MYVNAYIYIHIYTYMYVPENCLDARLNALSHACESARERELIVWLCFVVCVACVCVRGPGQAHCGAIDLPELCICMYVCMYVHICICMFVCIYVYISS